MKRKMCFFIINEKQTDQTDRRRRRGYDEFFYNYEYYYEIMSQTLSSSTYIHSMCQSYFYLIVSFLLHHNL